ncbi:14468_t:CDS:2, partial [Gigaspora rosea]
NPSLVKCAETSINRLKNIPAQRIQIVLIKRNEPNSYTQVCRESEMTIDGRKFNIVDIPGIFDTSKPNEEVFKEIAKTVQKSAHGIKAILFVFEAKRFTEEQKNALNGIKTFLGENALNYMIAVFSHATKKQNEDKDEMRKAWNPTVASFIGSIGNRWGVSPDSDYFSQNMKSTN